MKRFQKLTKKQLGEVLVERGVVTKDQLKSCIALQQTEKGLIGELLVQQGFATELDIAQALTCQYGFPYLPLDSYDIEQDILDMVPEHLCNELCLIPIDKIGTNLTLAMSNPLHEEGIERVEKITSCTVQIFVSTSVEIKESIVRNYKNSD